MRPLQNISILFIFVFLTITETSSPAGEAVFSRSGNSIYLVDSGGQGAAIKRLDLKKHQLRTVIVPGVPGDQTITSLARSKAGFILCLTDSGLFAWDDEKGSHAVAVCRPPERGHFVEVAYNPNNSTIALVTRLDSEKEDQLPEWNLFALFKGNDEPVQIFCRRVRAVTGMAFDENGILHFGTEGDLWMGEIVREDDFPPCLNAYRHTPLATRETSLANSSQMGADLIEVAGDFLYVHVRRMGGSGFGNLIRLKKPQVSRSEEGGLLTPFDLPERLAIYRNQLETVENLGENGTLSYLCVSPDGRTVHFRAHRDSDSDESRHWLLRDGSEPEPISVSEDG